MTMRANYLVLIRARILYFINTSAPVLDEKTADMIWDPATPSFVVWSPALLTMRQAIGSDLALKYYDTLLRGGRLTASAGFQPASSRR